jgi:hypothetical protein
LAAALLTASSTKAEAQERRSSAIALLAADTSAEDLRPVMTVAMQGLSR